MLHLEAYQGQFCIGNEIHIFFLSEKIIEINSFHMKYANPLFTLNSLNLINN